MVRSNFPGRGGHDARAPDGETARRRRPDAARGRLNRVGRSLPDQEWQLLEHRLHRVRPGTEVRRLRSPLHHVRLFSRSGIRCDRLAHVQDVGLAVAANVRQPGRRTGDHKDRQRSGSWCQDTRIDPWYLLHRTRRAARGADHAQTTAAALPNPGVARVDPGLPPSGPQDPSAWPPKEDPLDRIAKLARLHESGALTDTEFEREKAKILSQM